MGKTKMTRQHFTAIAETVRDLHGRIAEDDWRRVRTHFADLCAGSNDRFDRAKFVEACTPAVHGATVVNSEETMRMALAGAEIVACAWVSTRGAPFGEAVVIRKEDRKHVEVAYYPSCYAESGWYASTGVPELPLCAYAHPYDAIRFA